jgi:AhpD family alkylhydroperoxidase
MEPRVNAKPNPDVITAIQHLNKAIHSAGVDPLVLQLVHLRASQINECSACVYAGVTQAKKAGETDERLHRCRQALFGLEEVVSLVAQARLVQPRWEGVCQLPAPTSTTRHALRRGRGVDRPPPTVVPLWSAGRRGKPPPTHLRNPTTLEPNPPYEAPFPLESGPPEARS